MSTLLLPPQGFPAPHHKRQLVLGRLPPGDKTLRWQGPRDVVDLTSGTNLATGEVTHRFTTPILIVINSESRGTYFLGASSKDPVRL
jgi:hypothetical protein